MPFVLKYLFVAEHDDGSIVEQTIEDESLILPGRSAFADVDPARVTRFWLRSIAGDEILGVDLRAGKFFQFPSEEDPDRPTTERRLIYFRRHVHSITAGDGADPAAETDHVVTYHVGYSGVTADGERIEFVEWVE
jgi:hypothetical protein